MKKHIDPSMAGISLPHGEARPQGKIRKETDVTPAVIEALRGGDHNAYDRVFLCFYDKVNGFVGSLVKHREDAEDIVGDIFVRLWSDREKLDPGRNFSSFMYTSARNAVFNYFRHKKVLNDYAAAASSEEGTCATDEEFIAKETKLLVELTVNNMPSQRQAVFRLNREEGLSNDEIARQLGISRKTVEKHLRLALSDIKQVITSFMLFLLA